MDKKIILAKAGAGKTYHICHSIDPKKRNLVLAFTNQNISNIIRELEDANHGVIPELTTVSTFHSFVYRTFIRPYEKIVASHFKQDEFISDGVEVVYYPEPQTIKKNGVTVPNPKYVKYEKIGHFYTKNQARIYVERMSELPLRIHNKTESIIRSGIEYLNKFFDGIYIDEVQDFRENDWKLLEHIIKGTNNVTLVGDFYQHSVSGANNSGVPFKTNNTYDLYKSFLQKLKLTVDETTLAESMRCPKKICEFVAKKIGIPFTNNPKNQNQGIVTVICNQSEATRILQDNSVTKLLWDDSEKAVFSNTINWGKSKGDTYPSACVILTKILSRNFLNDNFNLPDGGAKNKLYVALTRTKGDLYIMKYEIYMQAISRIQQKN